MGVIAASCTPGAECLSVPVNIAFGAIASLMIYAAIRVVTTKNVVHAALFLVLVLVGVGANFVLLQAEFVAMTQILVYVGAIVVLFLFGIMLTKAPLGRSDDLDNVKNRAAAVVTGVVLLVVLGGSLLSTFGNDKVALSAPNSTELVSDEIFGPYLIPFEVLSVLLLAALIGAIVLARKD
jgi:NADH-quinone oxidoreductase subunit J